MKPILAASDSARRRFVREAQAAAAIDHDHIVHIYQVGEDRGVPFLAMQLLKGETLEDRLLRDKVLPVSEVLRLGLEIAAGLAAAHDRDLIHRDIKPANIWLETRGNRVKILDFGLARATGQDTHLTQQGAILGTPAFMAPEQVDGRTLDGRCDLFSLGCVLYRACTGQNPFKGSDTVSTLMAVATHQPLSPAEVNPQVPASLSDLIMQLLSKQPADRPANAHAVVLALGAIKPDAASKTVPQKTNPVPALKGASESSSKNRFGLVIAGGILAAVALVIAFLVGTIAASGRLIIDADDPAAEVVVKHKSNIVVPATASREIELRPGIYAIELANAKEGQRLSRDLVRIDAKASVRIQIYSEGNLEPEMPLSLLDRLDASAIAAQDRFSGQPDSLVGVLHHGALVRTIGFSLDGKYLASGGDNKRVELWHIEADGLKNSPFPEGLSPVTGLAFGPRSQKLVTGSSDGTLKIWDLEKSRLVVLKGRPPLLPISSVAYSLQGTMVASGAGNSGRFKGSSGQVKLWDITSSQERPLQVKGQLGSIFAVAFSSDGQILAAGGLDRTATLWDVKSGHEYGVLKGHKAALEALTFAPQGQTLATGSRDGTVKVWDWGIRKENSTLIGHYKQGIRSLVFSLSGKILYAGDAKGHVMAWNLNSGKRMLEWTLPSGIQALALAPDGRHLGAACDNGSIYVLRLRKPKQKV
jgi:WD40 repeat protein